MPSLNPHRSGFYVCGDIVCEVVQYRKEMERDVRSDAFLLGRSPGRSVGRPVVRPVGRSFARSFARSFEWRAREMTEAREASSRARVRANDMAEIETTYQVIKYEVGTRVDVGARATEDGWMSGWMSGEMSGERMMLGWMKTTRGGRTRGWRD